MARDAAHKATPEMSHVRIMQDHFNAAEAYKWKKHELIRELQSFEHDTGSMPVRIGLLTQRIQYLTRHTQAHRKDHHSRRGLLILLSRRRKSLRVLRRKDFDAYVKVWNKQLSLLFRNDSVALAAIVPLHANSTATEMVEQHGSPDALGVARSTRSGVPRLSRC